ncbi:uncharacterized protein LOC111478006 isoform X2 [Cucurbita maxima]|uniref:Uncharacterized protein LOC111478006 isoform X2 n=1 Tax=Cucurbita maxima TaxID=3661 RepID=A0A6J1ING1_CUCMA|nr:uncharacterized protein LOC111478006 isoform X2 [Cucurbita maxima]XP_022977840.1 uncharacterized protein LOC111478006 isoform X2 [Cucurbita maxima]XP_022977847.1 uncharacterized protein LOC111478006 isoform X2 [Cucurbita maxima]
MTFNFNLCIVESFPRSKSNGLQSRYPPLAGVKRSSEPLPGHRAFTLVIYIPPHSHSLLQHILTLVSECSINGLFSFECSLPKPKARSTRQSEEERAQAKGVECSLYIYIPPHSQSLLQHTLTLVSECSINGLFPLECSLPKPNARSTRQSEEERAQAKGVERAQAKGVSHIVSVVKNREERKTTNSDVIEIGADNGEGKNETVALDEVIAWAKEKQFVLSLRLDGTIHVKFVANS